MTHSRFSPHSVDLLAEFRHDVRTVNLGQLRKVGKSALALRGQVSGRVHKENLPAFQGTDTAALPAERRTTDLDAQAIGQFKEGGHFALQIHKPGPFKFASRLSR